MKRKILIGPHHGEHSFEKLNNEYTKLFQFKDLGYINNEQHEAVDHYIHSNTIRELMKTHENIIDTELDWGVFTELIYDDAEQEQEVYKNWLLESFFRTLSDSYITKYVNASGDDDTFDYMPSYTECIEQILILFKREDLIRKIRITCLSTHKDREEAEGAEFFTDEELDKFEILKTLF